MLLAPAPPVVGRRLLHRLAALRAEVPVARPAEHVVVPVLAQVPVAAERAGDEVVAVLGVELEAELQQVEAVLRVVVLLMGCVSAWVRVCICVCGDAGACAGEDASCTAHASSTNSREEDACACASAEEYALDSSPPNICAHKVLKCASHA